MIEKFIEKISSYNIFNNLFPGVIYVYIISKITNFNLTEENIILAIFIYYFIGMIISRFGSLVIERICKKWKIVKFSPYNEYLKAVEKNSKIEIFSEINNMYRTFISLFILVFLTKLYEQIVLYFKIGEKCTAIVVVLLLFILFIFSYVKQTEYITKNINKEIVKKE